MNKSPLQGFSLCPTPTFSFEAHSVHYMEPDSGFYQEQQQSINWEFFKYLEFNKTNLQRCKMLLFFPDADEQPNIRQKQVLRIESKLNLKYALHFYPVEGSFTRR